MAIRYGFFNSVDGDRVYNAENFCDYLGSIICDGIQDTYGDQLAMSVNGSTVTIGTGKAWINGHYIINDESKEIQLSGFAGFDVYIYIFCNVSESVRRCGISYGTSTPSGDGLSTLTLGKTTVGSDGTITLTDYRGTDICPWMRCILGKCAVTTVVDAVFELRSVVSTIQDNISALQSSLSDTQSNVSALQNSMSDVQNDVLTLQSGLSDTKSDVSALQNSMSNVQDDVFTLQNDLSEANGNISALQTIVSSLQETTASHTSNLEDLGDRLTVLENTASNLTNETIVYSEPVGTGVTATLYGSGSIRVNGNGAAEQSLSLEFSDAVESRYSITSRWEIMYGVTSLCDGFMSDIGAYAAIHGVIPGTYLPSSLTQIGDSAIPSISVGYAGTIEQWKLILGSDGESTITNSIFPSVMRNMQIAIRCSDGVLTWNAGAWEEQTT